MTERKSPHHVCKLPGSLVYGQVCKAFDGCLLEWCHGKIYTTDSSSILLALQPTGDRKHSPSALSITLHYFDMSSAQIFFYILLGVLGIIGLLFCVYCCYYQDLAVYCGKCKIFGGTRPSARAGDHRSLSNNAGSTTEGIEMPNISSTGRLESGDDWSVIDTAR